MHLSRTMDILERNEETHFLFEAMSPTQRAKARRVISKAILATDMVNHLGYRPDTMIFSIE